MDSRRIGLIANTDKPAAKSLLGELRQRFTEAGHPVALERDAAALLAESDGLSLLELAGQSDILVLLGGDGTLLHAAHQLGDQVKPLAAVNTGTLGFLTSVTADEIGRLVSAISESRLEVSYRSVLEMRLVKAPGEPEIVLHAANEVSISRGTTTRVVHLETWVDGQFLNHFTGDGLIVATPTGSTAYSLSAGGPIVDPRAPVFILTPICPHTLANRSVVTGDDSVIEVRLPKQRQSLFVTMDGQDAEEIEPPASLRISRAAHRLPLVTVHDDTFYSVLQRKLGWYGSTIHKGGIQESHE